MKEEAQKFYINQRSKLKYRKNTKWRFYLSTKTAGLGHKSIKLIYLQELVNLKKSLNKREEIGEMYASYEETICKRKRISEQIVDLAKSLEINTEELIRRISNNEETNKWMKEEAQKFYINQWSKLKCVGQFYKTIIKKEVDIKTSMEAWKKLGLNNIQTGTIMAFQEGATIIGERLAQITKNPRMKNVIYVIKNKQFHMY